MFEAPKLTNAGKALYYRNLGGEALRITTMQLGDGQLSTPIATLTSLIHSVVSIDAAVKQRTDYVEVNARFSNAGLSAGFYWREVGIFCADPDNPDDRSKDILYCYQNAYDTADYIAPAATELVEKSVTIPIIVGDTKTVTCTLEHSLIYITQSELEDSLEGYLRQTEKGIPGGIATLDSTGKLSESQRPEIDASTKAEMDTRIRSAVNAHNTAADAHSDIRAENAKLRAEFELMKLKYDTDVSKNSFSATFSSLDGLTVAGVWNADLARIEF